MSRISANLGAATITESFASILEPSFGQSNRTKARSGTVLGHRDEIFEQARQVGYEKGLEEGREEGAELGRQEAFELASSEAIALRSQEMRQFCNDLDLVRAQFQDAARRWLGDAEKSLEELSLRVAETIVCGELKTNPDATLQIIKKAMEEVTNALTVRVRINPLATENLLKYRAEILSCSPSAREIEFVPDGQIEGGCVLDTEGGRIDALVTSQIERLRSEMEKAA